MDSGIIKEIEDRGDDSYLIWFGDEDPESVDLGVVIYIDDVNYLPLVGDRIEVDGHGESHGLTYLCIDGLVMFRRSEKQAMIFRSIRYREKQIQELRRELESVEVNS